jgi:hypothetical protein
LLCPHGSASLGLFLCQAAVQLPPWVSPEHPPPCSGFNGQALPLRDFLSLEAKEACLCVCHCRSPCLSVFYLSCLSGCMNETVSPWAGPCFCMHCGHETDAQRSLGTMDQLRGNCLLAKPIVLTMPAFVPRSFLGGALAFESSRTATGNILTTRPGLPRTSRNWCCGFLAWSPGCDERFKPTSASLGRRGSPVFLSHSPTPL